MLSIYENENRLHSHTILSRCWHGITSTEMTLLYITYNSQCHITFFSLHWTSVSLLKHLLNAPSHEFRLQHAGKYWNEYCYLMVKSCVFQFCVWCGWVEFKCCLKGDRPTTCCTALKTKIAISFWNKDTQRVWIICHIRTKVFYSDDGQLLWWIGFRW